MLINYYLIAILIMAFFVERLEYYYWNQSYILKKHRDTEGVTKNIWLVRYVISIIYIAIYTQIFYFIVQYQRIELIYLIIFFILSYPVWVILCLINGIKYDGYGIAPLDNPDYLKVYSKYAIIMAAALDIYIIILGLMKYILQN